MKTNPNVTLSRYICCLIWVNTLIWQRLSFLKQENHQLSPLSSHHGEPIEMLNSMPQCHSVTVSHKVFILRTWCLHACLGWNSVSNYSNYSVPRITEISLPPELLYSESNLPPEVITAEFLIQFSLEMISCHRSDLGSTQEYRDTCRGKLQLFIKNIFQPCWVFFSL